MCTPYILHYAPDNASLIIRLALEELGLPFETRLVDRSKTAHRSVEYLALNPAGRIPTLETPDGPISETAAILLWLADRHGGLLPAADDPLRGTALNWLFFISNTLHSDMLMLFYTHRYGPAETIAEMRAAARKRIARHLNTLQDQAMPRLQGWIGGPTPSALDLYLAAILRWLQIYPEKGQNEMILADYPKLHDLCARLETRASVAAFVKAEGMNARPFTDPSAPNPPEGSAI